MSIVQASGKLAVTGFDPDQSTTVPVFAASIDPAQEAAFLEAVRIGTQGVLVPNDNQPPVGGAGNAIVVSDPGGGGDLTGPDVEYWSIPLSAGLVARTARTARPTGT